MSSTPTSWNGKQTYVIISIFCHMYRLKNTTQMIEMTNGTFNCQSIQRTTRYVAVYDN